MIKKIFSCSIVFFTLMSTLTIAQSSSPYSRFGIGDIMHSYSSRSLGMGELGTASTDGEFISSINPAGWYKMGRTRIELSLKYFGTIVSDDNNKNYYGSMEFNGLTFAFPVSSEYGMSVAGGMIPYSNVGYKTQQTVSSNLTTGDYNLEFEGSGGLTKIFLGSSYKLPFDAVLGASLDYYFGNLNYRSRIDFLNSSNYDTEFNRKYNPSGYGSTIGIISPDFSGFLKSEEISDFRLGLSLGLFSEMDVDTSLFSSSPLQNDTLSINKVKMKIPLQTAIGLSFVMSKNYHVYVDYLMQSWSNFEFDSKKSEQLQNSFILSAGMEYKPLKELGATFWEQIIWRCGLSYEKTPYFVNSTSINQYAVSAGLSFPMSSANTIDLGFQYAMRGTTDSNLLKENLFRFNLGISFGELWFVRPENK
ncbi:MAG: hypothetical protein IPM56_07775 [Ignavibacteriales bacterium]|nr:MAG: hypothetical protein IPM56_07775 [Ignavibacteriales bacterium]